MTSTAAPNAGWYADPAGQLGVERYWDGNGWTDQHRLAAPLAPPAPMKKKRRHPRIFTWFILLVNALFLAWVIAGAASSDTSDCVGQYAQACRDASHAGTAIGVGLIIVLWALVNVILGVIWLVTRKREPQVVYVQVPPSR